MPIPKDANIQKTEGTSPRSFDKIWQDYVWEFVGGFIAGDIIHETDNVATVMGQITGSLVPGVDIRDVAANLAYGDYGFALLSMIGLWTGGGDAAKAGGTVIKFVIKNADNLPMMINLFEGLMKNFPDLVADLSKNEMFTEMVERLAKADTSKLTKSEAETYEQFLRKAGVPEDIIKGGSNVAAKIIKETDTYIDYLNQAGQKIRIPKQSSKAIGNSINSKLQSANIGNQVEGKVANFIKNEMGIELTDFGNKVSNGFIWHDFEKRKKYRYT